MRLIVLAVMMLLGSLGGERTASADPDVPTAPRSLVPEDYAWVSLREPIVLSWEHDPGVTQYQIQVLGPWSGRFSAPSLGPGIDLIIADAEQVARQQFVIQPPAAPQAHWLAPQRQYSWRVRVSRASVTVGPEDSSWGPWAGRTFNTRPLVPGVSPFPSQPSDGSVWPLQMEDRQVRLNWRPTDPTIPLWEVQVSRDPAFNADPATGASFVWWNIVDGKGKRFTTDPDYGWWTPPVEVHAVYYWRVRPYVREGYAPLAWGPTWSFATFIPDSTSVAPPPSRPPGGGGGGGLSNPAWAVLHDRIRGFYRSVLCRDADPAGLLFYANSPDTSDATLSEMLQSSQEGQRVAQVRHMYQHMLFRDPFANPFRDCGGVRFWVDGGLTIPQIADAIAASEEYRLKH